MAVTRRGRRGTKLSKDDRARREKAIIEDIKGGTLSYRQIAAKHSVSLPTVNNKARKAGISRGRRKGKKLLQVRGPRPGRRPKNAPRAPMAAVARRAAKPSGRRPGRPLGSKNVKKSSRRSGSFQDAFRALVLQHYPNISLRDFDRLNEAVARFA